MTAKRLTPGLYDILLMTLMVLTMLAIIIGRAPYLHDFAEWVYQGQIVKKTVLDAASVSQFTMANYPVPNSLVTMLLAGLSFVFTPLWAGRVFLILMLLGWFGVIRLFSGRFIDPQWRGAASLVLFVSTALATFFWYGFASYQLALMLLTWFFAVYRTETPAPVVAAFGLAIFLAHAIVFLVFGLFLGVTLLLKWNKSVVVGLVPATVCSLWFLIGRHFAQVEPQKIGAVWSGLREAVIYKAGYPAMLGPFKNFLLPDGRSLLENFGWVYWPGLLVNFAVAAVLGILIIAVGWKYLRGRTVDHQHDPLLRKAWAISMALIMLFYLFAPYHFFGLVNAGGRLLLPLLLMAFMLGGRLALPFVRIVLWPVILFSFITSGSYFYLMLQTRQPGFSPQATATAKTLPANSVLEFNDQLYASTRYKYFNYRVFSMARRFDQVESEQFQGLTFRHGMLIKFQPEHK
jgi:hypothetical protein